MMKKFGFGKKGDDGDDSNRLALFGSKSKSKSPAPTANPYAQPTIPIDPYTQAKMNAYAPRPTEPAQDGYGAPQSGPDKYGADKGVMDNPYAGASVSNNGNRYGATSGGYGADKYGAQGGYGADRYGTSGRPAASQSGSSRYGAGGYGGLGGASAYDDGADESRDALFGGAKDRLKQKAPEPSPYGQPPPYDSNPSDTTANSSSQGYGSHYEQRERTAEEEEEDEVLATKQQIRFVKQSDVSSTRNALRVAERAEEVGRDTLARLGAQGEHIHNTEKNLDLAHNQNRVAQDKAAELKKLNRSMFAVHVANPFTAGARRDARDQAVIDRHLDERDAREATRRAAYQTNARLQTHFKELQPGQAGYGQARGANLAERAKYQFEADSEDEEMENEIDSNLDALGSVTGRLNALARATGQEVDEQNKLLDRIADKVSGALWGEGAVVGGLLTVWCSLTGWISALRRIGRSWTALRGDGVWREHRLGSVVFGFREVAACSGRLEMGTVCIYKLTIKADSKSSSFGLNACRSSSSYCSYLYSPLRMHHLLWAWERVWRDERGCLDREGSCMSGAFRSWGTVCISRSHYERVFQNIIRLSQRVNVPFQSGLP